jgi:hypothetical protein
MCSLPIALHAGAAQSSHAAQVEVLRVPEERSRPPLLTVHYPDVASTALLPPCRSLPAPRQATSPIALAAPPSCAAGTRAVVNGCREWSTNSPSLKLKSSSAAWCSTPSSVCNRSR